MDAMHLAFTRPLITEDSYKEALRVHFFAGFSGHDHAETYNINLLELNMSYAYLLTYAEYRNGMLRDETSIAKHFVQSFHSAAVEESYEDLDPTVNAEWADTINILTDRDGTQVMVHDGQPLFETPSVYEASIPGVSNLTANEVCDVAMKMSYSVASEIINNGNIPTYFDIALGYQHGERIEVQGTSVYDACVIFDDTPPYGLSFARAQPTAKGGTHSVGRGFTTPNFFWAELSTVYNSPLSTILPNFLKN